MKRKVESFHDLQVWQKADLLAHRVFDLTGEFPRAYLYDLTAQLRRAALSVPTNISEAMGSRYLSEKIQFFNIAKRSTKETEYLLGFAYKRGLIKPAANTDVNTLCVEVSKMLAGLIASLGKRDNKS